MRATKTQCLLRKRRRQEVAIEAEGKLKDMKQSFLALTYDALFGTTSTKLMLALNALKHHTYPTIDIRMPGNIHRYSNGLGHLIPSGWSTDGSGGVFRQEDSARQRSPTQTLNALPCQHGVCSIYLGKGVIVSQDNFDTIILIFWGYLCMSAFLLQKTDD